MPTGRPLSERSAAIKEALTGQQKDSTITLDLQPDEIESFSRFTQRARSAAKSLGLKIGVRADKDDATKGIVTIKETDLDPNEKPAKTGRRGRPRKEEAAAEEPKPKRRRRAKKDEDEKADDAPRADAPMVAEIVTEAVVDVDVEEPATEASEEERELVGEVASAIVDTMLEGEDVRGVAVCVSGSIAAYKACEVVRGLQRGGCDVAVAMTPAACEFVGPTTFAALTDLPVAYDLFEWPVSALPHIELADWADLIVVAPASADCIAKIAHGFADDCVAATVLAASSPVIVCPSMNVHMWQNPATQANVETLRDRGIIVLEPAEGYLVCGDWGEGKLAPVETIVKACLDEIAKLDA